MTYGQTSSGKTYTLFGDQKNEGLIYRFLKEVFDKLNEMESYEDGQFSFKYSFFEIYNDKIYDMLSQDSYQNLPLRETKNNKIYIEGLKKKRAKEFQDVLADLE